MLRAYPVRAVELSALRQPELDPLSAAIGELETHNANLLTENAILWQRSEEATREAELLRDRLDRVRRLIPGPLGRLAAKITR